MFEIDTSCVPCALKGFVYPTLVVLTAVILVSASQVLQWIGQMLLTNFIHKDSDTVTDYLEKHYPEKLETAVSPIIIED